MDRVVISKRVLDRLIRAKLMQVDTCREVQPLPVVASVRNGNNGGCNWTIPGWTGDASSVGHCTAKMETYLEFLRGQFDIVDT